MPVWKSPFASAHKYSTEDETVGQKVGKKIDQGIETARSVKKKIKDTAESVSSKVSNKVRNIDRETLADAGEAGAYIAGAAGSPYTGGASLALGPAASYLRKTKLEHQSPKEGLKAAATGAALDYVGGKVVKGAVKGVAKYGPRVMAALEKEAGKNSVIKSVGKENFAKLGNLSTQAQKVSESARQNFNKLKELPRKIAEGARTPVGAGRFRVGAPAEDLTKMKNVKRPMPDIKGVGGMLRKELEPNKETEGKANITRSMKYKSIKKDISKKDKKKIK